MCSYECLRFCFSAQSSSAAQVRRHRQFPFPKCRRFLYRPRQGHVIPVAAHQHAAYPQPAARLQRQRNHLCSIAFSPLTGANAIANVPAVMQQLFIQIMTNVDRAHKDISFRIQAKERRIRHMGFVPFQHVQAIYILFKVVIIAFSNSPWDNLFLRSAPFIHHFK